MASLRGLILLGLTLFSLGCGGREPHLESPYADALLVGLWREHCPGGVPESVWIRFRKDGTFDWSDESPDYGFQRTGQENWRLQGEQLLITWKASDATLYTLTSPEGGPYPGASTKMNCRDRAELQFVR